jgi:hypothetical protein
MTARILLLATRLTISISALAPLGGDLRTIRAAPNETRVCAGWFDHARPPGVPGSAIVSVLSLVAVAGAGAAAIYGRRHGTHHRCSGESVSKAPVRRLETPPTHEDDVAHQAREHEGMEMRDGKVNAADAPRGFREGQAGKQTGQHEQKRRDVSQEEPSGSRAGDRHVEGRQRQIDSRVTEHEEKNREVFPD